MLVSYALVGPHPDLVSSHCRPVSAGEEDTVFDSRSTYDSAVTTNGSDTPGPWRPLPVFPCPACRAGMPAEGFAAWGDPAQRMATGVCPCCRLQLFVADTYLAGIAAPAEPGSLW
jgi:hypothetical protein